MQGSRFIDTNIVTKKYQDRQYLLHQKKLQEINSKPIINRPDSDPVKMNHQKKAKSVLFHQKEKNLAIRKENQYLLEHLLSIGEGKKSQFRGIWNLEETSDNKRLMADTSVWKAPNQKRLNSPLRRKELQKIEEENFALAQRIVSKRSNFEFIHNQKEIAKYQQLRSQMTKYKTTKTAGSQIKLPPVEESSTAKYLRTLSQEKKKTLQDEKPLDSNSDQYNCLMEELLEKQKELVRLREAEESLLLQIQQQQQLEEEKEQNLLVQEQKETSEQQRNEKIRMKKEVAPIDQSQLVTEKLGEQQQSEVANEQLDGSQLNQTSNIDATQAIEQQQNKSDVVLDVENKTDDI